MNHEDLHARLAVALDAAAAPWAGAVLQTLPDHGLAHAHVRLVGHGVLARIPKQSQMKLAPADNLAYQAACFERAGASGHTPALRGVLAPSAALPRGALVVDEIVGRPAQLPRDLPAIAAALASLHALPLPPAPQRAPLAAPADALVELRAEIEAQAAWLDAAQVDAPARRAIDAELDGYRALCAAAPRPPSRLISFDAHPGNFIVDGDGRAVLVDLEKCRYGPPSLDLAHATLYTSTTWDVASHAVLDTDTVARAYADWSRAAGAAAAADAAAWHGPLRRAMWLWSVTWCAKWRVASRDERTAVAHGEDWSGQLSAPALVAHVRDRVDHYLSAPVVEQVRAGFDHLAAKMGRSDPAPRPLPRP